MIQGDMWLPEVKSMREIAWWVDPEHRGSSAGAKLLKEYVGVGDRLVEENHYQCIHNNNIRYGRPFEYAKKRMDTNRNKLC